MPIFLAITIIFASLLGYGTYMKESYVETPPSYAVIDTETEEILEAPLTVASSTKNIETISPAPTATLPIKTSQTTKPQKSDWTAPTTPSEVTATYMETKAGTSVTLSWSPSKDNVGVRGYRIFRDGNDLGTTNESYFADVEVTSPTLHRYSILAFDSEGNNSPKSASLTPSKGTLAVNTPAPTAPVSPTVTSPVVTSPSPTPTPPSTTPAPVVTPAPTLTLSASPTSVTSGSGSTLTWKSTNATSCTASGAWSGAKATSGTQLQSNLTASKTYTLACTGGGGTISKSTNVTVTAAAAPAPTPTPTPSACGSGGVCTAADIAPHNTRANCWVYLSPINKAYNITGYVANGNNHPGGDVIVPYCGKNMYGPFISGTSGGKKHSNSALNSVLQAYYIGVFQ